ncbi:MAG: hypothetical protein Q4C91_14060, partial [Eubacteriales bacterium]|nr:hypothetical protein [Eubacteriales bacterium]
LFIGMITEGFMKIMAGIFPNPQLQERFVLLLLAVVMMCFSASLYFTADLGVSAYDAWALVLAEHKVASFRVCRIGTDLICVLAGVLMGAFPGIGTVITAFGMGPLIDFFNKKFSIPLLEGKLFRKGQKNE